MEANKVRTFANDPNSYDKLVDSVIKEEVEAFTKDVCDKLADAAPGAFLSGAAGAAIGGFSFHLLRETAAKYAEDYKAKLDKGYSVIHGEKILGLLNIRKISSQRSVMLLKRVSMKGWVIKNFA